MGHIRLGELPRTRRWDQVVDLIRENGDPPSIASATLQAAATGFEQASRDEGVGWTTWLLTQLPLAAGDPEYAKRLKNLGLDVASPPSLPNLLGAFDDAIDSRMRRHGGRTDLGEMAQMAATETLASTLGARTQSLFGSTPDDVRYELASLATSSLFGDLAADYFSNLTRRYLSFYLSRELPSHIGGRRRFGTSEDHTTFDRALDLHCRQASRIVREFAGGWFSKTRWQEGLSPAKARSFTWVALKKVRSELQRGARPQT